MLELHRWFTQIYRAHIISIVGAESYNLAIGHFDSEAEESKEGGVPRYAEDELHPVRTS